MGAATRTNDEWMQALSECKAIGTTSLTVARSLTSAGMAHVPCPQLSDAELGITRRRDSRSPALDVVFGELSALTDTAAPVGQG